MKTAVLAGIRLEENEQEFKAAMDETASLCHACGIEIVSVITQASRSSDPETAFRKGKFKELCAAAKELDVDLIIFHNSLRIIVAQRISKEAGVNVIDRTALILDIFADRARSKQAKLQVELARLQYDLPRVLQSTADESGHERGGSAYNRGAGEMRSSLVQRRYGQRMAQLKKEIEKIKKQKYQDERRRTRTMMRRAALIGYTNAGKSSLMNAMIEMGEGQGKHVYEEDMLFATLDTSVRMIPWSSRKFLLYDTVGFVSDLPHSLIDAFQATLDAARDADLLIHVIDGSDPEWQRKADISEDTLKQIGAGDIPILKVFTKADLMGEVPEDGMIHVSSLTKQGMNEMMDRLMNELYPDESRIRVMVPYEKMAMAAEYRAVLKMKTVEETEEGMILELSGPARYTDAFRNMRI